MGAPQSALFLFALGKLSEAQLQAWPGTGLPLRAGHLCSARGGWARGAAPGLSSPPGHGLHPTSWLRWQRLGLHYLFPGCRLSLKLPPLLRGGGAGGEEPRLQLHPPLSQG